MASASMPSMPSVPLMSARPSFSASSTGEKPALASASAAGILTPLASNTSPSPMIASAHAAKGARSPEQPSDPYSGTHGVMRALSRFTYARAVGSRTPVRPLASVDRRSSMRARTTSVSTHAPVPAACERMSERCSCPRMDGSMNLVASAPKPVLTP